MTIYSKVPVVNVSSDGESVSSTIIGIPVIPYYSWANRGEGEMQIWVPRKVMVVKLLPKK